MGRAGLKVVAFLSFKISRSHNDKFTFLISKGYATPDINLMIFFSVFLLYMVKSLIQVLMKRIYQLTNTLGTKSFIAGTIQA